MHNNINKIYALYFKSICFIVLNININIYSKIFQEMEN